MVPLGFILNFDIRCNNHGNRFNPFIQDSDNFGRFGYAQRPYCGVNTGH